MTKPLEKSAFVTTGARLVKDCGRPGAVRDAPISHCYCVTIMSRSPRPWRPECRLCATRPNPLHPAPMRIIETTADLRALAADLSGAPYLALDTEFMRDQTYWPKLCLIQVASLDHAAIIDPLAPGIDLGPFYELLKEPHTVKV